jgi:tetratricopeptide (TPR) repeat protein
MINKNVVFYVQRGELYLLQGRAADALADFHSALELSNNSDPSAHFYAAFVYSSRGDTEKAIEHCTKAIENSGKLSSLTAAEKKYDDMVNVVEKVRRDVKKTSDTIRLSLTNFFKVRDYLDLSGKFQQEEVAKQLLDTTLSRTINVCDMYYNRALAYMYCYDYQSARADFETIMTITADDESQRDNMIQYLIEYSRMLYYSGELENAVKQLTKALGLTDAKPIRARILVLRACAYERSYMLEEATRDRNEASLCDPNINTTPFHIRLVSDDAICNIISYMDLKSALNFSLSSRQLNNFVRQTNLLTKQLKKCTIMTS